jgi:acylphosphatase
MAQTARRFYINGTVQGVGFRYFTKLAAHRLGLVGYAKNLPDGRVEVYAIGEPADIAKLETELMRGPESGAVAKVQAEAAAVDARYAGQFCIVKGH